MNGVWRARSISGVLTGLALLGGLAACGGDASRSVGVTWQLDPTTHLPSAAEVAQARKQCPGNAKTPLLPAPTSKLVSVQQHPLRYGATNASDRDVAVLTQCLRGVPGVLLAGLQDQDY